MTTKPVRQSNFELLRLIAMAFIVIHHCIVHGLGLTSMCYESSPEHINSDAQMLLFSGIDSVCLVAVNCFVLISGYFGIRTRRESVFSIVFQLFFYTILFSTIPVLLSGGKASDVVYSLFFISKSPYWFVIVYLILIAFAPMINQFCEEAPKNQLQLMLAFLIIFSCYSGFFWENHNINKNGYNIFQFITLYFIGRFIHKYNVSFRLIPALLCFVGCSFFTWLIEYYFYAHGHNFLYWTHWHMSWKMTNYNSPLMIGAALSLFFVFKNINIQSKAINHLAQSSLAVFLIQESWFRGIEYTFLGSYADCHSSIEYLFVIFVFVILFFMLAFIIDPLRRLLSDRLSSILLKN